MTRIVTALLLATGLWAQQGIENGKFADGEVGKPPRGWIIPGALAASSFRVLTVDAGCAAEPRCVLMEGTPPPPLPFGNLMQTIPAAGYHGKKVEMRARIRVEGPETQAQMWLRLDGKAYDLVSLDNMQNRPVKPGDWTEVSIAAVVPARTVAFVFGVFKTGSGKAWVEDVRLQVVGEFHEAPTGPLTAQELKNVTALAKLYGYVRFFHPSQGVVAANWQAMAVEGVEAVIDAKEDRELQAKLQSWAKSVAPTVIVHREGEPVVPPNELHGVELHGVEFHGVELNRPEGSKHLQLVRWKHTGVGLPEATFPGAAKLYHSDLETTPAPKELPEAYRAELVPGLWVWLPMALYRDGEKTDPQEGPAKSTPGQPDVSSDLTRAVKLADVVVAWNVFQHFYPYFDLVPVDWSKELAKTLDSVARSETRGEHFNALQQMVAALADGHGSVVGQFSPYSGFLLREKFAQVGGELLVVKVDAGANALQLGDRLLRMRGRKAEEVLAEEMSRTSAATEQFRRFRAEERLQQCLRSESEVEVEVEPWQAKGTVKSAKLACVPRPPGAVKPESFRETRPAVVSELEPGIYYIDLNLLNAEQWAEVAPKLEQAKGIVFDMRSYPTNTAMAVLARLGGEGMRSPRFRVPVTTLPDHKDVSYREGGWPMTAKGPRLTAPVVFLIDGRAVSYAETVMGMVEQYKLGVTVGEATAGTNGNINPFRLPSGVVVYWTGMRVEKHDGSQHHGVGIQPQVPVERTRAGIAAGKDEILLRGLEVAKGNR